MWFVLLAVFAVSASGRCPNVQVVSPFNATKYLGRWYEIGASPLVHDTFELACTCTNANYGINGTEVTVENMCNRLSVNGPLFRIKGYADPDPKAPAKLKVHFGGGRNGNYWVVYLDQNSDGSYQNAVVWSCEEFVVNLEWVWILSRTPSITSQKYNFLLQQAQKITGYDVSKITTTTQQGCKYQPPQH